MSSRTPETIGQDFSGAQASVIPPSLNLPDDVEFSTGKPLSRRGFLKLAELVAALAAAAAACSPVEQPTRPTLPAPGITEEIPPRQEQIKPTATLGSPEDTEVLVTGMEWSSSNGEAVLGMGGEIPQDVLALQEVKDELGRGWIFLASLVDQGLVSYRGVEMIYAYNDKHGDEAKVSWAIRLTDPALPQAGDSGYVKGALVRQGLGNEPLFIAPSGGVEQVVMAFDVEDNLQVLGLTNGGVLRKILGQDYNWSDQELGKFDPAETHDPLVLTQSNTDLFYNGHGGLVVASTELGYAWSVEPPMPPLAGEAIAIEYDEELKLKLSFKDKDNQVLVFDFEKSSWIKEATKPKEGFDPNRLFVFIGNSVPQVVDLRDGKIPDLLSKYDVKAEELWGLDIFKAQTAMQLGLPDIQSSYLGHVGDLRDIVVVLRPLKLGISDYQFDGNSNIYTSDAVLFQGFTVYGPVLVEIGKQGYSTMETDDDVPCLEWSTDSTVPLQIRVDTLKVDTSPPEKPYCSANDLYELYDANLGNIVVVMSLVGSPNPKYNSAVQINFLKYLFQSGDDSIEDIPSTKVYAIPGKRIGLPSNLFNQVKLP